MAQLTGLAGVLIYTGNFPPMLTFYRDTLGLTPRGTKPGFVNFEWGDVRLTVTEHSQVSGTSKSTDSLRIMVNFTVEDIQAVVARLKAAGVAFSREPEQESWGGWIATFNDPDGNTLQLFELPK
jgi:catechol 2,3-dioxygenase-like lactoylglutathione lyase family enzyme